MADTDIRSLRTTDMASGVDNYSVDAQNIDQAGDGQNETYWDNPDWPTYLGYYKSIPELKKAIDALAMWTIGKGWNADPNVKVMLEHISGWGEDTFQDIMKNLLIVKKINGDAFAEVIRDEDSGIILNIKPLNPSMVRIVVDKKGMIIRYDVYTSSNRTSQYKEFKPENILHFCNDRIANEIHGVSVVEACKWVIDARNEAMADKRRTLHRTTIRVMEIDSDDSTKLNTVKKQYAEAINKGEVLIVPKGNIGFPDVPTMSTAEHSEWIRYLENFFYQTVGVPKIILGGSEEFTEASSKIGYLTFEQPYMTEQRELEADLWNQLGIRVKFERPVSLKEDILSSEAANTGQMGVQPSEMNPGSQNA